MKVKKFLAGILAGAMVLGTMSLSAFAEDTIIVKGLPADSYTVDEATGTVTLTRDVTAEDTAEWVISLSGPEGVVFDGDGHTISGKHSIYVNPICATTIQNVVFDTIHGDTNQQSAIYFESLTPFSEEFKIQNCTFENIDWDAILINSQIEDTAKITISDNIFKDTVATDKDNSAKGYIHIEPTYPKTTKISAPIIIERNKMYTPASNLPMKNGPIGIYYLANTDNLTVAQNYIEQPERVNIRVNSYNDAVDMVSYDTLIFPLYDEALENALSEPVAYTCVKEGGYTWEKNYYNTLEEAFEKEAVDINQSATNKIYLMNDVTDVSEMTIPADKKVYLDLNTYSVTAAGDYAVESKGKFNIAGAGSFPGIKNNGNMTISGFSRKPTITGDIYSTGSSKTDLSGCTLTGNINADGGTTVKVMGDVTLNGDLNVSENAIANIVPDWQGGTTIKGNVAADGTAAVTIDVDGVVEGNVTVSENAVATIKENGLVKGDVTAADDSVVNVAGGKIEGTVTGNVNITSEDSVSSAITVDFVKNTDDTTGRTYDIVVKATDGKVINRLTAAELKFAIKQLEDADGKVGNVTYKITNTDHVNIIPSEDGRYEFNFDGIDDVADKTDTAIKIGEVVFGGYGRFAFAAVTDEKNKVHATKLADNIVTTYTADGATKGEGVLTVNEATTGDEIDETQTEPSIITDTLETVKNNLTVKVTFPNAISDNNNEYQQMKVTITGGDLDATIVKKLGTDVTLNADGNYEFTEELSQFTSYNVTVEGEGYRTVRYSVNIEKGDKTLTFWNNVKDVADVIEADKTTGAVKTTFLAGDIVRDNEINLYDLSAVVSYFGMIDLDKTPDGKDFAKYDLNRDGVIDSKDIAMVLVSWGY